MVKRVLCLVFCFILLVTPTYASTQSYYKLDQYNTFISACADFFGISVNPLSSLSENYGAGLIFINGTNPVLLMFSGDSVTMSVSSSQVTITSTNRFYKISYSGSSWGSVSRASTSYSAPRGSVVLTDDIPVTDSGGALYYTYSFLQNDFTEQISNLSNQVAQNTSNISTLSSQVSSVSSEVSSASNKLDTVISNQQTINNNVNKVNTSVNNVNNSVNNLTNTLTADPSSTESEFLEAFPDVNIDDPTNSLFENLSNGIYEALTATGSQSISFNFRGTSYSISTDDLDTSSSGLKSFLSLFVNFGLSLWLVKDLRNKINKVKNGKFEALGAEDVSANMV